MIALVSAFMRISTLCPHGVSLPKSMAATLATLVVKAWPHTPRLRAFRCL